MYKGHLWGHVICSGVWKENQINNCKHKNAFKEECKDMWLNYIEIYCHAQAWSFQSLFLNARRKSGYMNQMYHINQGNV